MARYRGTVRTARAPGEALGFVADFRNIERWDPSVVRARAVANGPLRAGSRFEVTTRFGGREIALEYEVIELEEARRAVLRAETPAAVSLDTIEARAVSDQETEVTYDADLRLRGVWRVAELPMRLAFARLGRAARAGLARELG